ncbi:UNVERIFIED_CONTAM: hypothetical protein HDU68_006319, partial [Siphonaria sp. JEL0065]
AYRFLPSKAPLILQNMLATVPPSLTYIPDFVSPEEEQRLLDKVYSAPLPKWTILKNRRLQTWGCTPLATKNNTALYEPLPVWLAPVADRIAQELPIVFEFDGKHEKANNCLINEVILFQIEITVFFNYRALTPSSKYLPNQGIFPHLDGPAYKPTVATVSLGEYTILEFYKRRNLDQDLVGDDYDIQHDASSQQQQQEDGIRRRKPDFRFILKPRSLVILQQDMYESYLHGISEVDQDIVSAGSVDNWVEAGMEEELQSSGGDGAVTLKRVNARVSLTFRVAAKVSKITSLFGKKR